MNSSKSVNRSASCKFRLFGIFNAFVLVLSFGFFGTPFCSLSYSDELADLEAKARDAQNLAATLDAALESVQGDLGKIISDLITAKSEIPRADKAAKEANKSYNQNKQKAENLKKRLSIAEALKKKIVHDAAKAGDTMDQARAAIAKQAREQLGGESQFEDFDVIIGSTSVDEFIRRIEVNDAINRISSRVLNDAAILKSTSLSKQERIKVVEELVANLKRDADAALAAAKADKARADSEQARLHSLQQTLTIRKAEYESRKGEIAVQQQRVRQQAADFEAQIAKLRPSGGGGIGPAPSKGFFGYPLGGDFIDFDNYGISTWGGLPHTGDDLASFCGAPVYASAGGTVIWAASVAYEGGNNKVIIDHGTLGGIRYESRYSHLTAFAVGAGARVGKGQVIGYEGATGWATGCHVHFEILVNGNFVNPEPYLRGWI
ncbi:MAG: peptidoglycan DD-metalloendopeptidase family protein [Bifidobacteriaceae bacterium]|jgi:murein DD-endopeptidase MepM/ murein hydrolase activator NlpD|nr:peptidoglycan DD-metalloendopeptidase family protein [Bifidobacteriaceae bacterium]